MKRATLVLLSVCSLLIISCQKEAGFAADANNGNGSGGGGATGDLLIRTENTSGSESSATAYTYDSNKKLINYKVTGTTQGIDIGNEFRYYRNSAGVITHYTQVSDLFSQIGLDSVTTRLNYNTTSSRYSSAISEIGAFGFNITDSTVFIYDATGKITGKDIYQGSVSINLPFELLSKQRYTYDSNGNVTQIDGYDYNTSTGTNDLLTSNKYTYDAKVNAFGAILIFTTANEAVVIGFPDWAAKNNVVKMIFEDIKEPSNTTTVTVDYTYNSANKPVTGKGTQMPGSMALGAKYFYQ
jgi:hypothetical protein